MVNQYNTCPLCHGPIKKNGTNGDTQRWRCKDSTCGYSFSNTNEDATDTKRFRIFQTWLLSSLSLTAVAQQHQRPRRTLTRWFEPFWYIQVPSNIDPHRVYEQVFIDGTYFGNNCLLVASSKTHVIAWQWCKHENTYNYNRLFDKIPPPTTGSHHRWACRRQQNNRRHLDHFASPALFNPRQTQYPTRRRVKPHPKLRKSAALAITTASSSRQPHQSCAMDSQTPRLRTCLQHLAQ